MDHTDNNNTSASIAAHTQLSFIQPQLMSENAPYISESRELSFMYTSEDNNLSVKEQEFPDTSAAGIDTTDFPFNFNARTPYLNFTLDTTDELLHIGNEAVSNGNLTGQRSRSVNPSITGSGSKVNTPNAAKRRHGIGKKPTTSLPASAFAHAAELPVVLEKGERDMCLTCIQYGRPCSGTALERYKTKKGMTGPRCDCCAGRGSTGKGTVRICLWKDSTNGILTYDDAHNKDGIKNPKNGKALRDERLSRKGR